MQTDPKKKSGEVDYEVECIYCGKHYEECTCWLDEDQDEFADPEEDGEDTETFALCTRPEDVFTHFASQLRT